jgi:hypothetical protein
MATVRIDASHEIGATAGLIWHYLNAKGPCTLAKLTKELDQPRDAVMQGVGWLAREGKVNYIESNGRAKVIGLV